MQNQIGVFFNSDFERGLNKRGYKSCHIISHELKKLINSPEKFLISPAKRAQLTFEEIFFTWFEEEGLTDKFKTEESSLGPLIMLMKFIDLWYNSSTVCTPTSARYPEFTCLPAYSILAFLG